MEARTVESTTHRGTLHVLSSRPAHQRRSRELCTTATRVSRTLSDALTRLQSASNAKLKAINLRGDEHCNAVDEEGVRQLSELLPGSMIVSIDLSSNSLGNESASAIAAALCGGSGATALRRLYLDCNDIGDAGASDLARALLPSLCASTEAPESDTFIGKESHVRQHHQCSLQSISLSGNQIGDRGAAGLAALLYAGAGRLDVLGLDSNRISDAGVFAFAAVMGCTVSSDPPICGKSKMAAHDSKARSAVLRRLALWNFHSTRFVVADEHRVRHWSPHVHAPLVMVSLGGNARVSDVGKHAAEQVREARARRQAAAALRVQSCWCRRKGALQYAEVCLAGHGVQLANMCMSHVYALTVLSIVLERWVLTRNCFL